MPYWLRNALLVTALVTGGIIQLTVSTGPMMILMMLMLVIVAVILGRALFYVVVIPTTMPGAFFWKNQGFVDHAREVGLADMQQLGVAYERHHAFDIAALLETIRTTTMKQKIAQLRSIFTG